MPDNNNFKIINPEVKDLRFTISSQKNEEVKSPNLTLYKGPKLYITRYGYVQEENHDGQIFRKEYTPSVDPLVPQNDIPAIFNYTLCRKPVRDGFLYIFEEYIENKQSPIYHEYCIVSGRLQKILWTRDNMGNVRKPSGEIMDFHSIHTNVENLWVAYSDVQWSQEYASRILDTNAPKAKELRENRFNKINKENWLTFYQMMKDSDYVYEDQDATSLNNLNIQVRKIKPLEADSKDSETLAFHNLCNYVFKDSSSRSQTTADGELPPTGTTLYFSVHDPIGMANDICEYMDDAIDKFEKEVVSLQSGTPSDLLDKLSNKQNTDQDKDKEDDIFSVLKKISKKQNYSLHMHAVGFYNLFYGTASRTSQDIYDLRKHIVSQDFLEKMLDIDKRQFLRKKINECRQALFSYMQTEYYTSHFDNYIQNVPHRREVGKYWVLGHIKLLKHEPSSLDGYMDLNPQKWSKTGEAKTFVNETIVAEEHKINELMCAEYDLVDDYLPKLTDLEEKIYTADDNLIVYSPESKSYEKIEDIISAQKYFLWTNMASIAQTWIDMPLEKYNALIMAKMINGVTFQWAPGRKEKLAVYELTSLDDVLANMKMERTQNNQFGTVKKSGKIKTTSPTVQTKGNTNLSPTQSKKIMAWKANAAIELEVRQTAPTKFIRLLQKIFDSRPFLGATAMFSTCTLVKNIKNMSWKDSSWDGLIYDSISISSTSTEILWFSFRYVSLYTDLSTNGVKLMSSAAAWFGRASVLLGGIISIWDGVNAIYKNNYASGAFYIASGLAMLYLWSIIPAPGVAASAALNWEITIVIGIIIILTFIAVYLQDTPIEEYLKNCILRSKAQGKITGWSSNEGSYIMQQLLGKKTEIVGNAFPQWLDMPTSLNDFSNILTYQQITPIYKDEMKRIATTVYTAYTLQKIVIESMFYSFSFNTTLDHGIRLYKKDHNQNCWSFTDVHPDSVGETPTGKIKTIFESGFNADTSGFTVAYYYRRLILSDGSVFPQSDKTDKVYFVQKIKLGYAEPMAPKPILNFFNKMLSALEESSDTANKRTRFVCTLDELNNLAKQLNY